MEITWLGHSCFRIKGREVVLVTDPYSKGLGYPWGKPMAHIVTVSHPHPGHSNAEGVGGQPKVVAGPGEYEVAGVLIGGIIGSILTLIFTNLLGPIVKDWGQQLRERLKGETRRFREHYIPALAEEHRDRGQVPPVGQLAGLPQELQADILHLAVGMVDDNPHTARRP